MAYQTHYNFISDTQANITAQVSDVQDGVLCWAVTEQTWWQLIKTSVAPLGPNVLATFSGLGRWLRFTLVVANYDDALIWNLNGNFAGYPTDTTAVGVLPATGGNATFDSMRYVDTAATVSELRLTQRVAGSGGTTSAEFLLLRGGVFSSVGIISLAALVAFDTGTVAPSVTSLLVGDFLIVRLRQRQTGNPNDLTAQMRISA